MPQDTESVLNWMYVHTQTVIQCSQCMHALHAARRRIAYLPQNSHLLAAPILAEELVKLHTDAMNPPSPHGLVQRAGADDPSLPGTRIYACRWQDNVIAASY